jgi:hypothetical protein
VNVVAMALSEASNADDHAEVIEQLMAGTAVASWAVYEPDCGWDPAGIAVTATRDGDDYVLTGTKDRVDFGVQFIMRQASCLGGGSTEMARNIISERILGMPREYAADRDVPFSQVRQGRS